MMTSRHSLFRNELARDPPVASYSTGNPHLASPIKVESILGEEPLEHIPTVFSGYDAIPMLPPIDEDSSLGSEEDFSGDYLQAHDLSEERLFGDLLQQAREAQDSRLFDQKVREEQEARLYQQQACESPEARLYEHPADEAGDHLQGRSVAQETLLDDTRGVRAPRRPARGGAAKGNRAPDKKQQATGASRQFPCPDCGRVFTQSGNLTRHQVIHSGAKPYTCSVCGKAFSQRAHMQTHRRVHFNIKPFVCDFCGKRFTQQGHLTSHVFGHRKAMEEALEKHNHIICSKCPSDFVCFSDLAAHMKLTHPQPSQPNPPQPTPLSQPAFLPLFPSQSDSDFSPPAGQVAPYASLAGHQPMDDTEELSRKPSKASNIPPPQELTAGKASSLAAKGGIANTNTTIANGAYFPANTSYPASAMREYPRAIGSPATAAAFELPLQYLPARMPYGPPPYASQSLHSADAMYALEELVLPLPYGMGSPPVRGDASTAGMPPLPPAAYLPRASAYISQGNTEGALDYPYPPLPTSSQHAYAMSLLKRS